MHNNILVEIEMPRSSRSESGEFNFYADLSAAKDEDDIVLKIRTQLESIYGRAFSLCDFKIKDFEDLSRKILKARA
jgi:hypothetical protein